MKTITGNLVILENETEKENFHQSFWGREEIQITKESLKVMMNALYGKKFVGYQDGEYSMTMKLMEDEEVKKESVFYVQMKTGVSYIVDADEMNTMEKDQITFHKNGEMVGMVRSENVEMVFKDVQPNLI